MKPGLHAEAITAKVFNIKRWYQSAPPPAFFDGYRCDRLPANLLQAMRDYFGAHTYQRIDAPLEIEFFIPTGQAVAVMFLRGRIRCRWRI